VCGAIIARDAERTIGHSLQSLDWTDSLLVVVDDRTRDGTADISARCGARVEIRPFVDYGRQRNLALQLADCDWVFFVDADEVVPPSLAEEIRGVTSEGPAEVSGYWVPRKNILFGRTVDYAGWSPDYQLRLLRRGAASYRADRSVHELVELDGSAGHLRNRIIHHNYSTLRQFLSRQRTYSSMEATDMLARGVRIKPHNYLLQPWRQFWRRFVLLQGYRGGPMGLFLSVTLAYYEFRTYRELRSLWRDQGRRPGVG
jgi:(heptosyl)LPS beta-1,4-glucosyltransferase